MRTLLPALALFALFSVAGILIAGDPPFGNQDSRPNSPAKDDVAGEEEKVAAAGKNPLDDPKWQQKAKLGKMIAKKRCVICHKIDGKGGVLSPPMEEVTAKRFAAMAKYDDYVKSLKGIDPARYRASKEKLDAIVAEEDRYQKLILWLKSYIKKPTFDNGKAKMTPQALKKEELENIIAYLLTLEPAKEAGESE